MQASIKLIIFLSCFSSAMWAEVEQQVEQHPACVQLYQELRGRVMALRQELVKNPTSAAIFDIIAEAEKAKEAAIVAIAKGCPIENVKEMLRWHIEDLKKLQATIASIKALIEESLSE